MKNLITILVLLGATTLFGQVGIGTTNPNADALLDVDASVTTGGLLLPRLALTATTNAAPLSAHVAGMTVYNTATVNDVTPGFYYNDGTVWVKLSPAITYRNEFIQTSQLTVAQSTFPTAHTGIPGIDGQSITVPADGYYQFDFSGFMGAPEANSPLFGGEMNICNAEGEFRLTVNGVSKLSFVQSASFANSTNSFYNLATNSIISKQIYLTAGTYTIDMEFGLFYNDGSCKTTAPNNMIYIGGGYAGGDDCTLVVSYVGN